MYDTLINSKQQTQLYAPHPQVLYQFHRRGFCELGWFVRVGISGNPIRVVQSVILLRQRRTLRVCRPRPRPRPRRIGCLCCSVCQSSVRFINASNKHFWKHTYDIRTHFFENSEIYDRERIWREELHNIDNVCVCAFMCKMLWHTSSFNKCKSAKTCVILWMDIMC